MVPRNTDTDQHTQMYIMCIQCTPYTGVKANITLPGGTPPESYGTSLAIWDHTVLPFPNTSERAPPNMLAGTLFTYPGLVEG